MKRDVNFFKVSHLIEERYGEMLKPAEKYFLIILLKLENRYSNSNGWFWHTDKKFLFRRGRKLMGFESYGFSVSFCKRIRKKLKEMNIIKIEYNWNCRGNRYGTSYQINHQIIDAKPKDQNKPSQGREKAPNGP